MFAWGRAADEASMPVLRMVTVGDDCVGKTTLVERCVKDIYIGNDVNATVGTSFRSHTLEIEPGVQVTLQIWDTSGLERCRSITKLCIDTNHRNDKKVGYMLVFDISDPRTFASVKSTWVPLLPEGPPRVLVGHKTDRQDRTVSREEAEELARELGMPYVEASSVTGHNVKEAFQMLTRQIYRELPGPERDRGQPGAARTCRIS